MLRLYVRDPAMLQKGDSRRLGEAGRSAPGPLRAGSDAITLRGRGTADDRGVPDETPGPLSRAPAVSSPGRIGSSFFFRAALCRGELTSVTELGSSVLSSSSVAEGDRP